MTKQEFVEEYIAKKLTDLASDYIKLRAQRNEDHYIALCKKIATINAIMNDELVNAGYINTLRNISSKMTVAALKEIDIAVVHAERDGIIT